MVGISGEQKGGEWRIGTGYKEHKWQVQNRQGEVKNNMGNGEGKELISMTHGHELRWGNEGGRGCTGQRRVKGRKKWDNYNSIINEIYLKQCTKEDKIKQKIL